MIRYFLKGVLIVLCLMVSATSFIIIERTRFNSIAQSNIQTARAQLTLLSKEEKAALSAFLLYGISFDGFGHTLLEQKPMSILCLMDPENYKNPEGKAHARSMQENYTIWKNHPSLFPDNKYKFIEFANSIGTGSPIIALIDIKLCKTTIQKHLSDFQQILKGSFSAEEIFNILTNPNNENFYNLIDNDFLQGILYGFGRNNAYLYEHNIREKLNFFDINRYPLDKWIPSKIRFLSPSFVCDLSTDETKELQKLYDDGCKTLYWTYFGRDPLETTLAFFHND